MRLGDLIYYAKRELREAIVERYARPLRERVAVLEGDNRQLHEAMAVDVMKANAVINAARDVVSCEEYVDRSGRGPCGRCLELLDVAVEAIDGPELKNGVNHHG